MPKIIDGDIHFNEDESNNNCCPVCHKYILHYGKLEIEDDVIKYTWSCQSCGANGKEIANTIFNGHVVHYLPKGYIIPNLETEDNEPETGDSA